MKTEVFWIRLKVPRNFFSQARKAKHQEVCQVPRRHGHHVDLHQGNWRMPWLKEMHLQRCPSTAEFFNGMSRALAQASTTDRQGWPTVQRGKALCIGAKWWESTDPEIRLCLCHPSIPLENPVCKLSMTWQYEMEDFLRTSPAF